MNTLTGEYTNPTNSTKEEKVKETENSLLKIKDSSLEQQQNRITIDEVLDRIGYTNYHIVMLIIVGLSLASDGVELYLIYLISPVLKQIYNLNENQLSLVVSSLFMGMGVGAILSGFLINKFGRKNTILFFLLIISIFGTICIIVDNIYWFVFCRIIIGISIGVLFNMTNALCEILPSKYRDFIMGSIYFYLKLGILYFVFVFYLYTKHENPINNYKSIIICSSIPVYLTLILSILFLDESPRILLNNENTVEEGFKVIEKIALGSKYVLTEREKKGILLEVKKVKEKNIIEGFSDYQFNMVLISLFNKKYLKLILPIVALWMINNFILISNLYSLPILLEKLELKNMKIKNNNNNNSLRNQTNIKNNYLKNISDNLNNSTINLSLHAETLLNYEDEKAKKMEKIIIANTIPLPAEFLAGALTSVPQFGRKNTMGLGFLLQTFFAFMMYYDTSYIYIYSSLILFANVFSFNIIKLYTVEAFHTYYRDTAYGFSNFCSRIVSIIAPFIVNLAFHYSVYGPCFTIAGVGMLGILFTYLLPFETHNRALDKEYHSKEVNNKN